MKKKDVRNFEELGTKVKIKVSNKVKEIHPVVKHIIYNLAIYKYKYK